MSVGLFHNGRPEQAGAPAAICPASSGRRQLLGLAVAGLAGSWAPALHATPARDAMAAFTGGRTVLAEGLHVELPTLADNANAVPVAVRIDGLATPASYCEEMVVIAERNPRPLACRFRFTPLMGAADVAFRIRLAESQHITVLARMSDGRLLQARREITVAAGGCGG